MKTIGNYINQPNKDFPLDAEGLLSIQDNVAACELLGNIAGDKVIIQGCELSDDGTQRAGGWVWLKTIKQPHGELMQWEGGVIGGGMHVKSEFVAVQAEGYEYGQAYTVRVLSPGYDNEQYSWNSFSTLSTNKELKAQIEEFKIQLAKIKSVPAGVIEMWAGSAAPEGYLMCEGQNVAIAEYAELYAAIGTTYNNAPAWNGVVGNPPAGYFKLPDLRGRFVVGLNNQDNDYKQIGSAGGSKVVTLTADQIPKHDHTTNSSFNKFSAKAKDLPGSTSVTATDVDSSGYEYVVSNMTTEQKWKDATIKSVGGDQSHENRPPYYAISYIIKTGK